MNSVKREVFNFSQFLQTEKNITNAIQISPTARKMAQGKNSIPGDLRVPQGQSLGLSETVLPKGLPWRSSG